MGFVLLETTMAIALFGIVMTGVICGIANIQHIRESARDTATVVVHAQRVLEAVRLEEQKGSLQSALGMNWQLWAKGKGYNTMNKERISIKHKPAGTNIEKVSVEITWQTRKRPMSYEIVTWMTERYPDPGKVSQDAPMVALS